MIVLEDKDGFPKKITRIERIYTGLEFNHPSFDEETKSVFDENVDREKEFSEFLDESMSNLK